MLREIQRDVVRTFGTLSWFGQASTLGEGEEDGLWKRLNVLDELDKAHVLVQGTVEPPRLSLSPPLEEGEKDGDVTIPTTPTTPTAPSLPPPVVSPVEGSSAGPQTRREQLLRPLVVFASLNPGLSYVQGMNSLVAIFYYVFSTASPTTTQVEAESATFFALGALVSQLRDLYVRSLDGTLSPPLSLNRLFSPTQHLTPTGLGATLDRFTYLLNWLDPTLGHHLTAPTSKKRVDPSLFVFKWITTMFAAGDFALPDLLLIWDRLFTLFPSPALPSSSSSTQVEEEALTPILGHLLDLSLGIVLMNRPLLVSPFSDFSKCVAILQNPKIEGREVERLLGIAWEIRERRLGRGVSMREGVGKEDWKSTINKRFSSGGSPSTTFRSRFLGGGVESTTLLEEDDTDSERSYHPPPPASLPSTATIDQKQRESLSSSPDPTTNEDDLPPISPVGEGPTLATRAWGSWKSSIARIASSDAAASFAKTTTNYRIAATTSASRLSSSDAVANLSKRTTNLSIQAQLLRDQVSEQGPSRLKKMREDMSAASGRLMASTDSEIGAGKGRRPGSPILEPFTPPTGRRWGDSPTSLNLGRAMSGATGEGRESDGLSAEMMSRGSGSTGSGGPKPLLLSGSVRRAGNVSSDSPPSSVINGNGSRRTSWAPSTGSPSLMNGSPLLSPDNGTLLGRRGSHGRSRSTNDSPAPETPSKSMPVDGGTSPSLSRRVVESSETPFVPPTRSSSSPLSPPSTAPTTTSSVATISETSGRTGWSLSDAPVGGSGFSSPTNEEAGEEEETTTKSAERSRPSSEEFHDATEAVSPPVVEDNGITPTKLRRQLPSIKKRGIRSSLPPSTPLDSPDSATTTDESAKEDRSSRRSSRIRKSLGPREMGSGATASARRKGEGAESQESEEGGGTDEWDESGRNDLLGSYA